MKRANEFAKQFGYRAAQLLRQELTQPKRWMYLSFASDERFLGAAMVEACGIIDATTRAHQLGINPGGEVLCVPVPPESPPPKEARNRLLSKEDLERIFGDIERFPMSEEKT